MGASIRHLQRHPRTGLLSFRRVYPVALRPFIDASPKELKISLGARSLFDHDAAHRYCEAASRYARAVAVAEHSRRGDCAEPLPVAPSLPLERLAVQHLPIPVRPQGESFVAIAETLLLNPRLNIGQSTKEAARTALRFFRETHGKLRPNAITKAVVTEWLDLLAMRPSKLPKAERALALRKLVAMYDGRDDTPRLNPNTYERHLENLAALWAKAQDEGAIPDDTSNPFRRKVAGSGRKPMVQELTKGELAAIFALPIFVTGERPAGGKGEASYWIPLLLLHLGARPEEVAQMMVTDISQDPDTGRWMIAITDEGTHPYKGARNLKTSKTQSGSRVIPIPLPLLDLNFVAYVECIRRTGETALFPKLRTKGKRGLLFPCFGEWWGNYIRDHGVLPLGGGRKPSREFRHNWTTAARASGLPREASEYIQGHRADRGSAHEVYGSKSPLGLWIDKLELSVDLTNVRPWTPSG